MWDFFIKNNRFSYLLIVAFILLGIYSLNSIPRESAPEVIIPIGVVSTIYPGAPARDVESLITNEIERGLKGSLENITELTSTSREGVSTVVVEFDASADIDESMQDLKDEVDLIVPDLPSDAEEPLITEISLSDIPILTYVIAGELTDFNFVEIADALENEIEGIPGVSKIETSGVQEREVTVVVDQTLLERFDLSITNVTSAIAAANNTFPIGEIISDGISYNVAFEGDITDTSEIKNLVITTRGGTPIFLRDIATIDDGLTEAKTYSRLSIDGTPSSQSMSIDVYKQTGGDVTKISDAVNMRIDELKESNGLLDGLSVYTSLDSGKDVYDDLIQLSTSGLQTVALVIIVLVIAIGWREGLIAGTAIPLSFMIGFVGLFLSGNTFNFLSLFALILGIGVLVDSAIVVVEGINKRMKDNPKIDKVGAAQLTVHEYQSALTSGTLTTVSMFIGLFIVSGIIGQYIASIPFTLVFLLFASLLVALGFLPLIASSFLRRRSTTIVEQKQTEYAHRLESWYKKKLSYMLGDKKREIFFGVTIILLFIASIALIPLGYVKVVFFEDSDADFVTIEIELPEGTQLGETDLAIRRIEDRLYDNHDIKAFVTTVGTGSAFGNGGTGAKLANINIELIEDRSQTSMRILDELRHDLSDIRDFKITVSQLSGGPPTGDPIGIKLMGDDLAELSSFAHDIAELLKAIPGTANVSIGNNSNSTEYVLTLDKAKAASFGLTPQGISHTLRTAVYGADATSLSTLTTDIDVVVKLNLRGTESGTIHETNYTTIDTIRNLKLATPTGDTVLLSTLADVSVREANNVIEHEDNKRIVALSADTTPEGNVMEINRAILERIDTELVVPDDIEIVLGGETEDSDQAFAELFWHLSSVW